MTRLLTYTALALLAAVPTRAGTIVADFSGPTLDPKLEFDGRNGASLSVSGGFARVDLPAVTAASVEQYATIAFRDLRLTGDFIASVDVTRTKFVSGVAGINAPLLVRGEGTFNGLAAFLDNDAVGYASGISSYPAPVSNDADTGTFTIEKTGTDVRAFFDSTPLGGAYSDAPQTVSLAVYNFGPDLPAQSVVFSNFRITAASINGTPVPVPEPMSLALLGAGLALAVGSGRLHRAMADRRGLFDGWKI